MLIFPKSNMIYYCIIIKQYLVGDLNIFSQCDGWCVRGWAGRIKGLCQGPKSGNSSDTRTQTLDLLISKPAPKLLSHHQHTIKNDEMTRYYLKKINKYFEHNSKRNSKSKSKKTDYQLNNILTTVKQAGGSIMLFCMLVWHIVNTFLYC